MLIHDSGNQRTVIFTVFDCSFRYHLFRISEKFPRNFTWLYELYNSKTYGRRRLIYFPTIYHLGDTINTSPAISTSIRCLTHIRHVHKLINLKDISYAIHNGPPRKTEDYLQETGRAAREREKGSRGRAILLKFSGDHRGRMPDDNMNKMVTQERCRSEILTVKFNIREKKPQDCCDHCYWDITLP